MNDFSREMSLFVRKEMIRRIKTQTTPCLSQAPKEISLREKLILALVHEFLIQKDLRETTSILEAETDVGLLNRADLIDYFREIGVIHPECHSPGNQTTQEKEALKLANSKPTPPQFPVNMSMLEILISKVVPNKPLKMHTKSAETQTQRSETKSEFTLSRIRLSIEADYLKQLEEFKITFQKNQFAEFRNKIENTFSEKIASKEIELRQEKRRIETQLNNQGRLTTACPEVVHHCRIDWPTSAESLPLSTEHYLWWWWWFDRKINLFWTTFWRSDRILCIFIYLLTYLFNKSHTE